MKEDKLREELRKSRSLNANLSDQIEEMKAEQRMPKNMDFVQLARSEMRELAELGERNPLSLKLFMALGQLMNKQNAVMISSKAMQKLFGKSKSTVDRAVRVLKEEQWIKVVKIGTANAYVLNPNILWTDRNDKKGLIEFNAKIVTTLDEQEKDLRAQLKKGEEVKLKHMPVIANDDRVTVGDDSLPPPDQTDLDLN